MVPGDTLILWRARESSRSGLGSTEFGPISVRFGARSVNFGHIWLVSPKTRSAPLDLDPLDSTQYMIGRIRLRKRAKRCPTGVQKRVLRE